MNEAQKKLLVQHMNQNDGDTFEQHARWASRQFGVVVTAEECSSIFMDSMF